MAKKATRKATKKAATKSAKSSRTKPAAKKAPARKKVTGKKSAAKKAPAKKTAAKKTAAKKSAKKKTASKAPAKKAAKKAVKKTTRKAAKKKTIAKKAVKKKAAKKKTIGKTTKKTAAKKKAPVKKPKKAVKKEVAKRAAKTKASVKGAPSAAPEERKQRVQKSAAARFIPDIDQPTGSYSGVRLVEKVKPFPKKTPYTKKEIDKLREALLNERRRLMEELTSISSLSKEVMDLSKEHPGYSVHMAEHATDLQTAEANLGVRSIEFERLELVEAALDRIENNVNHYGLCLACGNKIGIQRLIARPHAHLCMDCRQRYEKIRSRRGY